MIGNPHHCQERQDPKFRETSIAEDFPYLIESELQQVRRAFEALSDTIASNLAGAEAVIAELRTRRPLYGWHTSPS